MSDITERLRSVETGDGTGDHVVHWYRNPDGLEAADEIERLRGEVALWRSRSGKNDAESVPQPAKCTGREMTLTDAEREAIETAMNAYGENNDDRECEMIEATLWTLLERTK